MHPHRKPPSSHAAPLEASWLMGVLDALDVGVLVVGPDGQLVHLNRLARHELSADHPLQLFADRVRARHAEDVTALHEALAEAHDQGLRRLLTLGRQGEPLSVAVLPLPDSPGHALLVLGRRRLGDRCMLHWFARQHGLTPREQRVLEALAEGRSPGQIAAQLGVGIATVRSHIGALRTKVGAASIRSLLHRVASLPPMAQRLPQ